MNRVLFTGASGFLGSNIYPLLNKYNDIETLGRSKGNDNICDLSSDVPCLRDKYDIVLHLAGKAHLIGKTEEDKEDFHKVNYQGTVNLCRALEKSGLPKSFIFVSTVAVYGIEYGNEINEEYPLKGKTPYAVSKIKAEQFLGKWCEENNIVLGIIRPSLIAGPNPPGNLGAMIRGIKTGRYFSVKKGNARKSILMARDVFEILPELSRKGGVYNLCDDIHPSFLELESLIACQLNKNKPIEIPYWIIKLLAKFGDFIKVFPVNSIVLTKLTSSLTFSNEKAKKELNWKPLNVLDNFTIV